jgi:hypothetical protein
MCQPFEKTLNLEEEEKQISYFLVPTIGQKSARDTLTSLLN